ncbi:MAG: metallophosphoesterase [Erysipelotrichaceae bacterium]|nr:metallophosphoesterase [Erysipelotrichaceae bacterium]
MRTKFLHISDLHFSFTYERGDRNFCEMMKKMSSPLEQIRRIFDEDEKDYDFVCVTGDICEFGTEEEYRYIHDWLQDYFGCPVIGVSGNHEDKQAFIHGFLDLNQLDPVYQEYYFNGFRVICLDSSDEKHNDGIITHESCQMLRKSLKDRETPTIVITHHHLIEDQFDMPIAIYGDDFREIIRSSNILAILNGHTHHAYEGTFEGRKYYTAGSFSFLCSCTDNVLNCYEHASGQQFVYEDGVLTRTVLEDESDPVFLDKFRIG